MQETLIGLFGVPNESKKHNINKLLKRAKIFDFGIAERYDDSQISLLVLNSYAKNVNNRIYKDSDQILSWIGHVVYPGIPLWPDSSDLFKHISKNFKKRLSETDGLYAMSLYDKKNKTLSLSSDLYGIFPIYYRKLSYGFVFGTSVDLLIHVSDDQLSLNYTAIAEYWSFRHCLGDKTFLCEINRIPQGKLLKIELPSFKIDEIEIWSYLQLPEPVLGKINTKVIVNTLNTSIHRRLNHEHKQICLLSGGWDSRVLSTLLARRVSNLPTITTYGDKGNMDDPECARLVADALELQNTYIPLPNDYIQKYWKEKSLLTDFGTTMHTWLMPLTNQHQFKEAVNFDGIAGDVLIKGLGLRQIHFDLLEKRDFLGLQKVIMDKFGSGQAIRRAVAKNKQNEWYILVYLSICEELKKWDYHPNTISFFILTNRTRRAIGVSPCLLLEKRLRNVAPFLDKDVLAATFSVNPSRKLGGQLYREVIKAIDQRLIEIPSTNDKNWPENYPRRRRAKLSTSSEYPLISYLNEIFNAPSTFQKILDEEWLMKVATTIKESPSMRNKIFNEVQCVAEIAFWTNTYGIY